MMPLRRSHTGFTLIELVLTIVLLGFVSLILIPFVQSISHSPDPMLRQRAVALGQALMDEVLAKRWDENTPAGGGPIITGESPDQSGTTCTPSCVGNRLYCFYTCDHPTFPFPSGASAIGADGESRTTYDDVDDYNDMPQEIDNFIDQDGKTINLPGYRREVRVDYIDSNSLAITESTPTAASSDTKRIVVTVTSPIETFTLVAVLCNF